MAFGLSAAAIGGIATAVGGIGSAIISGNAADKAASAQTDASNKAIGVQQANLDEVRKLLAPYVNTGTNASNAQANLVGLNGANAQSSAIDAIRNGPLFDALNKQGQDAILQNASATGGLRGGNVQAALAQFSPALLQSLIESQYSKLGGLAGIGENAAAMTGNAGSQTATNIGTLLNNIGSAQAGGAIGGANAINSGIGSALGGLGYYLGGGGLSGTSGSMTNLNSLFNNWSKGF